MILTLTLTLTGKPPLWLKHGDEVICEIDGIGRISNRVQAIPARL